MPHEASNMPSWSVVPSVWSLDTQICLNRWSERAQPDTPRLVRYELCVTGASILLAAEGKVLVIKTGGCRSKKACRVHGGYDKSRVECRELCTHQSDHNRQLAIPKRTSQRLTPCDALLCFHSGASYSINAQRNVASNAGQKEYRSYAEAETLEQPMGVLSHRSVYMPVLIL